MANPYLSDRKSISIPFYKPTLTKNEIKSVLETLVEDGISTGNTVANFEKEFAMAFEFERALAVPSLFAAYHLAFLALGIQEGDEVILPATAPVAALDALGQIKAIPVLVDVARNSFHPEFETIVQCINNKTKAILIYYPFGAFHDYEPLRRILLEQNKNLKIIEDITYLAGCEYHGHLVGSNSHVTLVGLHEDALMTIGKGAMILTDDKQVYAIARDLRMHAGGRPYRVRYDYTITDYQAAMGLEQLSLLPQILERRRKIAEIFLENLAKGPLVTYFQRKESDGYGLFPVFFQLKIEEAQNYFQSFSIETRRVFPLGPLFHLLGASSQDFPNTERLYQRGLLIPLYPILSKLQTEQIASALRQFPR